MIEKNSSTPKTPKLPYWASKSAKKRLKNNCCTKTGNLDQCALGQIQRKCLKQPWRRENSLQSEPFYTCEPPSRQIFFFYKIEIETLTNQKLFSIMTRIPFFKSCYRVLLIKVLVFYISTIFIINLIFLVQYDFLCHRLRYYYL